jgi:predicted ATPase/DNA-binding CsgD family transcriptional regulator
MSTRVRPPTASAAPTNLPYQLTSFVGREREIAEVTRLLGATRLLTLTGAGGCGKTRLALQVAAEVVDAYPGGVWLVELAPLDQPDLVPRSMASTLGVREAPGRTMIDSLADYLGDTSRLIILDNCEHVVAAAAQLVDTLLRNCPHLQVLATSREALGVAGETMWRVPSLAVPPDVPSTSASLERLMRYEAVRLFVDRALATRPGLTLTDQQAPALAEICRRLDGIPLALELAAARVNVFSVEQIAARLDDRFRLLTAGQRTAMPRQQTLQAMVDWSYDLLAEPERALLRRLSVFAGGWTYEAAEGVCAGDGIQPHAMLDLLAQLVDKSLVIAEEQHGAVRYRLLETIRQYARDRLLAADEAERTRDRHLAYNLRLAEEAEPDLRGPESRTILEQLEEEHDNLRVALEWGLAAGRDEAALRLSSALAWFWWMRGHHDEGRRWLMRTVSMTQDRSAARMKALHSAGWLVHHQRDSAAARALLSESLEIARERGDQWTVAWVLHHLGRIAYFDNDPVAARTLGEASLAVAEAVGDDWLTAWALHLLGLAAYIAAEYPTAWTYYARSLAIRRRLGYHEGIGMLLVLMGLVAVREGDLVQACTFYQESLTIMRNLGGPWNLSMPLATLSHVAAIQGQAIRAARLAGAVAALGELHHTPLIPLSEELFHKGLAMARQALGEAAYAAAWAEGRSLTLPEAIAEALAVEVTPSAAPPARERAAEGNGAVAGLTAAEGQVLRLLAGGRTTREIAAELVVAVSTVDRHLTHIYQKLGVRNRAEATAFALKHGLA